jgi:hypothetical protein
MNRLSMKAGAIASLTMLVMGAGATLRADDAKKRELKLAKCAAAYKVALAACENEAQAAACYQQADATDLACRRAEGAAGNSEVESTLLEKRRTVLARIVVKLPLNCGTGLNATCADGHARFPICNPSGEDALNAGQGRGGTATTITQDAQGNRDVCSGETLRCPAGFTLSPRRGQDLCWDSAQNRDKYAY